MKKIIAKIIKYFIQEEIEDLKWELEGGIERVGEELEEMGKRMDYKMDGDMEFVERYDFDELVDRIEELEYKIKMEQLEKVKKEGNMEEIRKVDEEIDNQFGISN